MPTMGKRSVPPGLPCAAATAEPAAVPAAAAEVAAELAAAAPVVGAFVAAAAACVAAFADGFAACVAALLVVVLPALLLPPPQPTRPRAMPPVRNVAPPASTRRRCSRFA